MLSHVRQVNELPLNCIVFFCAFEVGDGHRTLTDWLKQLEVWRTFTPEHAAAADNASLTDPFEDW